MGLPDNTILEPELSEEPIDALQDLPDIVLGQPSEGQHLIQGEPSSTQRSPTKLFCSENPPEENDMS